MFATLVSAAVVFGAGLHGGYNHPGSLQESDSCCCD